MTLWLNRNSDKKRHEKTHMKWKEHHFILLHDVVYI